MKSVNDIVRMLTLGTADKQLPAVPKSAISDAAFRPRDVWNVSKSMVYGVYVETGARKSSDQGYGQVIRFRNVAETYATVARRTSIPQEELDLGLMEKTGDPLTTISNNLVVVPCS